MKISNKKDLLYVIKNKELWLTHVFYLEALKFFLEKGGSSRGSYLVIDEKGVLPNDKLGDEWRFRKYDSSFNNRICETYLDSDGKVKSEFLDVKPIPNESFWFENVWNDYRQDKIVKED